MRAVMQVQHLQYRLSFCGANRCSPKEMEISVTGRALTGAQIKMRSPTFESWTEPRKWKSFFNIYKSISCAPLSIRTPLASFIPSSSGRADFSITAGRLASRDEVIQRGDGQSRN
jgi:hypothetical protein